MICEPCKAAGWLLAHGRINSAKIGHQNCEHPATCPCAHQLKSVVREEEE